MIGVRKRKVSDGAPACSVYILVGEFLGLNDIEARMLGCLSVLPKYENQRNYIKLLYLEKPCLFWICFRCFTRLIHRLSCSPKKMQKGTALSPLWGRILDDLPK